MRINVGWILVACLLCGTFSVKAQEQKKEANQAQQELREVQSPEKAARRATERMRKELQLTDKQYEKIYKLNLKEEKKRFSAMSEMQTPEGMDGGQRPEMGGGRPPMEGGMDFGGPGGMGPGMGGGMGGRRPQMGGAPGGRRPMMTQESAEDLQKAAAAKEKKIKKILTEEQFTKWQKMQQQEQPRRPEGNRPEKGDRQRPERTQNN